MRTVADERGSLMVRWHEPRVPRTTPIAGYEVKIAKDAQHGVAARIHSVERDTTLPTHRYLHSLEAGITYSVRVRAIYGTQASGAHGVHASGNGEGSRYWAQSSMTPIRRV